MTLPEVCAALALETGDARWVAAHILADALEEQKLDREAEALRYLAKHERWPACGIWYSVMDYDTPVPEDLDHAFFLPSDRHMYWFGHRTGESELPIALMWFVWRYVSVYLPSITVSKEAVEC